MLVIGASQTAVTDVKLDATLRACTKSSHAHSLASASTNRAIIVARRKPAVKTAVLAWFGGTTYLFRAAIRKTAFIASSCKISEKSYARFSFTGRFQAASTLWKSRARGMSQLNPLAVPRLVKRIWRVDIHVQAPVVDVIRKIRMVSQLLSIFHVRKPVVGDLEPAITIVRNFVIAAVIAAHVFQLAR